MDKPVEFTKHALERITERGADYDLVVGVMTGVVKSAGYLSENNPDMLVLTAKDDAGKYWTVVNTKGSVITVRRAHKKEERLYDEKYR